MLGTIQYARDIKKIIAKQPQVMTQDEALSEEETSTQDEALSEEETSSRP